MSVAGPALAFCFNGERTRGCVHCVNLKPRVKKLVDLIQGHLECGVPHGSCLGPLFIVVYASKIFEILDKHNLEIHCYADDSRLYLSFCPNNANREAALAKFKRCIEDIRNWMQNYKWKLNGDKTEFMIIGTSQQLAKVSINSLPVGTATITPVSSASLQGA